MRIFSLIENAFMEREALTFRDLPRKFFQEKAQWLLVSVPAFIWLCSFGVISYGIGKRDAAIILHYNVYFGIDVLGIWWQAYFIPIAGFLMWLVHILLSLRLFQTGHHDLSRIALFTLIFLESMILVTAVAIILVNY